MQKPRRHNRPRRHIALRLVDVQLVTPPGPHHALAIGMPRQPPVQKRLHRMIDRLQPPRLLHDRLTKHPVKEAPLFHPRQHHPLRHPQPQMIPRVRHLGQFRSHRATIANELIRIAMHQPIGPACRIGDIGVDDLAAGMQIRPRAVVMRGPMVLVAARQLAALHVPDQRHRLGVGLVQKQMHLARTLIQMMRHKSGHQRRRLVHRRHHGPTGTHRHSPHGLTLR